MDSKCAKCAMLALILQVAHVAHASEACETCETSLLQTVHNAHESHSENVKSLKSSCLSFIHIPKTGGGTIESARVKAAGTEWNATRFNFNPDARCFQKVREKRLSRFEGDHSHPNASFRFWGACDDQVQCSSDDATSLPLLQCNFMTHAGAHGRCSRWHVPPGLDFTVAASYTRNPFYKSTENSGNSFASLSTCDTFCVVRDPMQRLLSQLNWEIAFFLGNSSYCNSEFFEDWAARRLTGLNTRGDCHYVPQVYYVFENGDYKHGRQICHHVIKTDDLETKFPSLMKQYDLDVELADKHLHSGKCDLTPTPKTVEMVKTFYAGDYSAFDDEVQGLREQQKQHVQSLQEQLEALQEENRLVHEKSQHHSWSSYVEKTQLAQAHEGKTNEVAAMSKKLEAMMDENVHLKHLLESLTSSKMQTEHSARGLEANLATVTRDLEHRVSKQASLEEQLAGLHRQLEHADAEKVKTENLISNQHVELMALQKLHADMQEEKAHNHSLQQKLESSDMTLTKTQQEKEELEKMVSSLHSECAKVRTQRDSVMAEVPHMKASLQQQESLLKEQEHQVSALQNKLKALHGANGALDKEAKHLSYTLQRLHEEKRQVEQAGLALRSERQQLLEALERLRQSKAESHARLSSATSESGLLQARCQQMHSEREQLQLRLQQSMSESASLRSQLVGMEKRVQDYSDEMSALQRKVALLQESQQKVEAEKPTNLSLPTGQWAL
eukprot:symbB.v1.2.021474.t1/scaffold1792.1/size124732/9